MVHPATIEIISLVTVFLLASISLSSMYIMVTSLLITFSLVFGTTIGQIIAGLVVLVAAIQFHN